jgi:hypothetical protein
MTAYEAGLTVAEATQLGEAIAGGDISRSCAKSEIDWFNVWLASGVRACGSYRWGAEDFIAIRVYRRGRRA